MVALLSESSVFAATFVASEVAVGCNVTLDRLNADMVGEFHRSIYLWRSVDLISAMASSVPLIINKPEDVQLTAAELAVSVEMKDAIARDVVMVMGVPTQLVGIPGL